MNRNFIFLIVGIVVLSLGFYQNTKYEEGSVIVNAVVTRIETKTDSDDGSVKETYYGDYTVDGKEYKDIKLASKYNNYLTYGDTVEIRVYPDNPGKTVPEGGLFAVIGLVIIVYNGYVLYKQRKARKLAAVQMAEVSTMPQEEVGETHL